MADPMEEEEVTDDEYRAALEALQSTISGKTRAAPKGPNDLTWEQQFDRLHLYLERLGMTESVNAMSYIHVAGTKGKGSTCAFVDACLRRAGTRTGLYTSPHLVDIRERYRIDGRPVSKTTFTRNFWWLHAKLRETCEADLGMPAYFRFLTLLGFRIFTERAVDAVVLEVGLGGRLDATNVIRRPPCAASPRSGWTTWRCSATPWVRSRGKRRGYSSRTVPRSRPRRCRRRCRRWSGAPPRLTGVRSPRRGPSASGAPQAAIPSVSDSRGSTRSSTRRSPSS